MGGRLLEEIKQPGKREPVSAAGQPVTESRREPQSEHLREVRAQPSLSNNKTELPLSVTAEAANQEDEPLTPSSVMSLHTKRKAVAKL